MWCWRRKEKISVTDHVKNEEVLHGVKEERNILHTVRWKKANWIGTSWVGTAFSSSSCSWRVRRVSCSLEHQDTRKILKRNCLLKHVFAGKIEGMLEVAGRRGKRLKQLLDDIKETRGLYDKFTDIRQHNKYSLEYLGFMFRPVNRSSSGHQYSESEVLFRYWDPNI